MDCFCAISAKNSKVVHLTGRTGFNHQTCRCTQAFFDQMLVNGRQCQQGRNGNLRCCDAAVADDENVFATLDRINGFGAKRCQFGFNALMPPCQWIRDVERVAFKFTLGMRFNVAQLLHICGVKHGLAEFQPHWRVDLVNVE